MQLLIETHKKNGQLGNAYLFEGDHGSIFPQLLTTLSGLGIKTEGNPDIWNGVFETFGVDDARQVTQLQTGRPFGTSDRFFFLYAQSLTPEAQNALLKTFEDTSSDIHFFLVVPRLHILLPTLRSRFIFVATENGGTVEQEIEKFAKDFFSLSRAKRIKALEPVVKEKDKDMAARYLDFLEAEARRVHVKDTEWYKELYAAKQNILFRGASMKLLLEGLALSAPMVKK